MVVDLAALLYLGLGLAEYAPHLRCWSDPRLRRVVAAAALVDFKPGAVRTNRRNSLGTGRFLAARYGTSSRRRNGIYVGYPLRAVDTAAFRIPPHSAPRLAVGHAAFRL